MKKIFFTIFMFLPMMMSAQNVLTPEQQLEQAQKQLEEAKKAVEAAKAAKASAEKAAKEAAQEAAKKEAAQKAAKEAAEKAAAEKAAKIQQQIKAAQEEVERLKAEAEKLNNEAEETTKSIREKETSNPIHENKNLQKEKVPATELKPAIANEPSTSTNTWSIPTVEKKTEQKAPKQTQNGVELKEDPKYLEGAITLNNDGKVEFQLNTDANGKSAQEIYDIVYKYMAELTQSKNNISSRVALVNKNEHIIANMMDEWLVFNASFISLDRTEFKYQLVAKISDNALNLTLSRIYYNYEEGRSTGFKDAAENVITDKIALTKKKNDLAKIFGKFRKCTIDRKDQIFNDLTDLVKQ